MFICENNLYSVYTGLRNRQSKSRSLKKIAESNDILYFKEDGNDAIKVYRLIEKVIKSIKQKKKPALIEFYTYRWLEHCGPNWDDQLNYRPKGELSKWMKKCPLNKIKKNINEKKIFNLQKRIDKEINNAFYLAKKSQFPKKEIFNSYYF